MTAQGWIAVLTLAAAIVCFVARLAPPEVVALTIPVVLVLTRVVEPADALGGFGDPAVITLGAIFVVGAGLHASGVASLIARWIHLNARHSDRRLLLLLMISVAAVSAFMPNAATVALFLPAAVSLSRKSMIPPSRLLMPVSFAAVLGGNLTLMGNTPNLIVSAYRRAVVGHELPLFSFTPVAIPLVAAGILLTALARRRLLPEKSSEDRLREALLPEELAQSYGIGKNLSRMRLVPKSKLIGKTIAEAGIRSRYGLSVVVVLRPGSFGTLAHRYLDPRPDLILEENDEMYLDGPDVDAWRIAEEEQLQFGLAGPQVIEKILGQGQTLAEVALSHRAQVFGKTLRDLGFRARYGLNALSLWRKGAPITVNVAETPLELGDAFLVSGPAEKVRDLARDRDFLVLTDHSGAVDVRRAPLAVLLLLVAIVPPIVGAAPLAVSSLAAALLMIATRCVTLSDAYRAIDLKVLFLIAGTFALARAMEQTGVAAMAADAIIGSGSLYGKIGTVASLFGLAAIGSIAVSNSAAALILSPVAGQAAASGVVTLDTALLAVAYGCSCSFILPTAQWNLLVMGPGGYHAKDFFRYGGAMSLVFAAVAIAGLVLLP